MVNKMKYHTCKCGAWVPVGYECWGCGQRKRRKNAANPHSPENIYVVGYEVRDDQRFQPVLVRA